MTFFYDLNKKLDTIREKPEVTHKQLNERGEKWIQKAVDPAHKGDLHKALHVPQGEKIPKSKINKATHSKDSHLRHMAQFAKNVAPKQEGVMDEAQLNELSPELLKRARDKAGQKWAAADDRKDKKASAKHNAQDDKFHSAMRKKQQQGVAEGSQQHMNAKHFKNSRNFYKMITPEVEWKRSGLLNKGFVGGRQVAEFLYDMSDAESGWAWAEDVALKQQGMEEGMMDIGKMDIGKKVAGAVNKAIGHGSDEDMIKDLQRKSGAPVTGKKPTFADKIANAKKEVDEMLGDVAAEAIKTALSPKQKGIAKLAGNPNEIGADDLAALRKGRKPEMDEDNAFDYKSPRKDAPKVGSVERGHKHDIKHTATGRMVTRRTDDQGISVGSETDDEGNKKEKRTKAGRPDGTGKKIGAKGPSGKSKLMTKENDIHADDSEEYDQEGEMAMQDLSSAEDAIESLRSILTADENLPEWVQAKITKAVDYLDTSSDYMKSKDAGEKGEELDEEPKSKNQAIAARIARGVQKGTAKAKPGSASAEMAKMKPKELNKFAKGSTKGLPKKVSKKKEEEVEESSTESSGSKGGMFGKGIYDSINRELEQMIAESMSINMSDSTEGGKSLTITATDEDALKLGMMLKNAGLGGGDAHGGDMHSHGEESCPTCGMEDCGCGDVQEAVDENAPDWPTNTETSDDALQYAGGLNKPKTDVAGDGQTTIPNTAVHTQDEDALRRMMEMAGIAQAELEPWKETMKEEAVEELDEAKECSACHKSPCECDEEIEEDFLESIQRMREIAGIKEAKKQVDQNKDGKNDWEDVKIARMKASGAIKDKEDEKKVEESIFALTNQWKAYRG